MPAYYSASAEAFVRASSNEILGALAKASRHETTPEQASAWLFTISALKAALEGITKEHPAGLNWGVLLEYPLLRLSRRLDAVVLAGAAVCVLEFKGASNADAASRRQAEDYAADLRCFHGPTRSLTVFPAVCAPEVTSHSSVEYGDGVYRAQVLAP